MQTGTGQVLDGSSRGLSTASMPADSSSKLRSGKSTQTDSGVSMRHSCQTAWESTIENGQQAKQTRRSSFSFKKTANRKTSWCMCTDGPVTKDQSGWGFTVKHGSVTLVCLYRPPHSKQNKSINKILLDEFNSRFSPFAQ